MILLEQIQSYIDVISHIIGGNHKHNIVIQVKNSIHYYAYTIIVFWRYTFYQSKVTRGL